MLVDNSITAQEKPTQLGFLALLDKLETYAERQALYCYNRTGKESELNPQITMAY